MKRKAEPIEIHDVEALPVEPRAEPPPTKTALRYTGPFGLVVVNGRALHKGDTVDGPADVVAELSLRSDFVPVTAEEG